MSGFKSFLKSLDIGNPVLGGLTSYLSSQSNRKWSEKMMDKQNAFNAQQAQLTREYNEQMDSTKYQRTVADMQAAGVNPALAMNGGVTTQASSNATASSANVNNAPLDLSAVAQLAMQSRQLRINDKVADAQVNELNSRADKNKADAIRETINNQFLTTYNELRNAGMELSNSLTDETISQVRANVDKIAQETELLRRQCTTESERLLLTRAETSLKEATRDMNLATTRRIIRLLPYERALMSAKTEHEQASAALAFVQKTYQSELIDKGYVDALVADVKAGADTKEAQAWCLEFENALKSGDTEKLASLVSSGDDSLDTALTKSVFGSVRMLGSLVGSFFQGLKLPSNNTYNQTYFGK